MKTNAHLGRSQDYYGLKFLGMIVIMILGLAYASFYLTQNFMSNSFMLGGSFNKPIYFLKSFTLKNVYQNNKMDYTGYESRIAYFQKIAEEGGYKVSFVEAQDLKSIAPDSILVVLDMLSLDQNEIANIANFVSKGGKILFNFRSGFLDQNLNTHKNTLLEEITPLTISSDIKAISYDKNSTGYLTLRLLSPLVPKKYKGEAYELTIYDPLPVVVTPSSLEADAYLTNWLQTDYLHIKNQELQKSESGLIWHGGKQKGKWVYFSFPSYVFMGQNSKDFKKIFFSMLQYLKDDFVVNVYPYIDTKNAIFVSQDTEYKFETLEDFSELSQKNHFPVTAFCVAKIAQEHKEMMQRIAKNNYLEIGSHSYTHKKIVGMDESVYERETSGSKQLLETITGKRVIGFRPPREEIDNKMIENLASGGFKYIFNKSKNRLYPSFVSNVMLISRHGTDDYSYFVDLDWNATKILNAIEKQSDVVTSLNGIFTLSLHSHLMSYGTNIQIEDRFYRYINSDKTKTALNGAMIYDRVNAMQNFSFKTEITPRKLIITLSNSSTKVLKSIKLEVSVSPGVKPLNIDSEIIGFKTKLIHTEANLYTIEVEEMQPKSQVVLFVNYEKN